MTSAGSPLAGRAALVTGAGGEGMGRSIALTLARDGADVALNYHRKDAQVARTAAAIEALGRRARPVQGDITDAASVEAMVRAAEAEFGRLDIVVANAGAPWKPQDVTEIEPAHLRRVLAAEVEGVYALLRAALPGMRARRWGRFALIGGHMADAWTFGPPEAPLDYPLGKAARHWIARTLGPREAAYGVTINVVAPGPTRRFTHDEAIAALTRRPSGAGNTPQDIAEAIVFLCSDAAARVNGAIVPVPGDKAV